MRGRADIRVGSIDAFVAWEPILRLSVHDRAVYQPATIGFHDRNGAPLELRRSFTLDSDPDEMGHFLSEAGGLGDEVRSQQQRQELSSRIASFEL
jgi:hypothetical protein